MGSCPDTDIDQRNDLRSGNEHYLSSSENKA